MPKSKYYKALGLPNGSSEAEIRKAFRKLVMKYHPDKNDSPGAQDKFIQITEAYEILIGKKSMPAQNVNQSRSQGKSKSEDERKKRAAEAKLRYQEQQYREYLEDEIYYRNLTSGIKWKTIRVSAVIGVLFALLLTADYFLPHHYTEDRVTGYALNRAHGVGGKQLSLIATENNDKYWLSRMTYSLYGKSQNIYVESSWIFHNPIRIISREKLGYKYFDIHFNVYRHSWVLLLLFIMPALLIFYKRKKVSFTVLFHFCYYVVNIMMILFLLTGDRWAHFLTMGFI